MPAYYYYHIFFEVGPDDGGGRSRCFEGVVSRRNLLPPPASPSGVIRSGGLVRGRSRTDGEQADRPAGNAPGPRQDWRSGRISVQSIDMGPSRARTSPPRGPAAAEALRGGSTLETGVDATATKGRFVSLATQETDLGWGVVHLYRDGEATPGLYDDGDDSADLVRTTAGPLSMSAAARPSTRKSRSVTGDEDCTTVCILAVPSYLTPADFMGFIGERTTSDVTHIRMVRTERVNRYMVLMKFRDAEKAKRWRRRWNGKPFNSVEPEYCHVVFIKSIRFQSPGRGNDSSTYPNLKDDPLTPASSAANRDQPGLTHAATKLGRSALSTKPTAPPTPSLMELPTCPVCLERMDETTGLLTILCQHVFHCECLQKWRGTGCPVCRYTQGDGTELSQGQALGSGRQDAVCSVCGAEANLWICLICGNVGCGRYDEAHAFSHYEETGHSYVMDIDTQRVWDYVGDGYVHRLIQDKSDAKLEELPPGTSLASDGSGVPSHADELRAQEKLEDIGIEYTHLLRSQLESQRLYFEEKIAQAADKASQASRVAEDSTASRTQLRAELDALSSAHATLSEDTMPSLERDKTRLERRAEKASATARAMEKAWREEKTMNESLLQRIGHLEADVAASKTRNDELRRRNADLDDQNRDLACFISGSDKIARLNEEDREDVVQGTVSLGEAGAGGAGGAGASGAGKKNKNKNKGKRKGKGVGIGPSVGANTGTGENESASIVEGTGTAEGASTVEGASADAGAGVGTGASTDMDTGTDAGAGASTDTSPDTGKSTEKN